MSVSPVNVYGIRYSIEHKNGQRIVVPFIDESSIYDFKEDREEIYFWGIPKHLTEMDLLPIFASIGPVWKLRVLINFYGHNRGFGFVQYFQKQHYETALKVLHEQQLIRGCCIKLEKSRDKKTLIVGGLYQNIDHIEVLNALRSNFNIKYAKIVSENGEKRFILQFYNHNYAALKRRSITDAISNFGRNPWVGWRS